MSVYKPSELMLYLQELGIGPRKALSQNFLIDGNIIRKIVATAGVKGGDTVLEIGPGPGALTEELLSTGARVIAVEKDPLLAEGLKRLKGLEIYCNDILDFPLEDHIRDKAKVIANLPYNITTPILVHLVPKRHILSQLVLMVQDEVALRMTAKVGSSEYSSLTLFLNYYTHPRYAFKVSNNCFYPAPKVQSAIVVLDLKEPPQGSDETKFFKVTRRAFEQKRKSLRSSLREIYDPQAIENALIEMGKSPLSRPQEFSVEDFIQFIRLLA